MKNTYVPMKSLKSMYENVLNGCQIYNSNVYLLKQWSTPAVTESELELGFFLFFLRPTSRPDDNKRAVGIRGQGPPAPLPPPSDFGRIFSPSKALELEIAPPDCQTLLRSLNKARKKIINTIYVHM